MSDGFVYFIREEETGNIKIGFSEKHPKGRLNDFQTGNSNKLELLGFIEGSYEDETDLHDEFEEDRIRDGNEWFFPSTRLKERIRELLEDEVEQKQGSIPIFEEETLTTQEPYPTNNYSSNRKKDKLTSYSYRKFINYNRWQAELIEADKKKNS